MGGLELLGRWALLVGLGLAVVGLGLILLGRTGFVWRPLPGDIVWRRPGVVVFLPLTTMLLLSLLGSLLWWALRRLRF